MPYTRQPGTRATARAEHATLLRYAAEGRERGSSVARYWLAEARDTRTKGSATMDADPFGNPLRFANLPR